MQRKYLGTTSLSPTTTRKINSSIRRFHFFLPLNSLWRCNQPLVYPPWGHRLFLFGRCPGAPQGLGRYKIPSAQGPVSPDTFLDCVPATAKEHGWLVLEETQGVGVVLDDRRGAKLGWNLVWQDHNGHPARGDVVDRLLMLVGNAVEEVWKEKEFLIVWIDNNIFKFVKRSFSRMLKRMNTMSCLTFLLHFSYLFS